MFAIVLCVYVLVLPLLPNVAYIAKKAAGQTEPLVNFNATPQQASSVAANEPIPSDGTLVIPRINLQQKINDGSGTWVLSKGLWRRPQTGTPDKGGNTVIVGHRFTYSGPAVFYHLDKVKKDDIIVAYWQGKKYSYAVTNIRVVDANESSVEAPTKDDMLTLYTCTPLWSAKDRLVIQAKKVAVI